MEAFSHQHLYSIATNIPYFYTGHLADGTQTLMGVQLPHILMIEFDADGNYLKTSLKEFSEERQPTDAALVEADAENEFSAHIYGWQVELKVIPSTISVKRFYLPERFIGITDLPEHYQQVLDYPENFTEERLQELQGDIEAWRGSGEFVLDWDEDYYMSEKGEVEST